jgi:hypothetical protein
LNQKTVSDHVTSFTFDSPEPACVDAQEQRFAGFLQQLQQLPPLSQPLRQLLQLCMQPDPQRRPSAAGSGTVFCYRQPVKQPCSLFLLFDSLDVALHVSCSLSSLFFHRQTGSNASAELLQHTWLLELREAEDARPRWVPSPVTRTHELLRLLRSPNCDFAKLAQHPIFDKKVNGATVAGLSAEGSLAGRPLGDVLHLWKLAGGSLEGVSLRVVIAILLRCYFSPVRFLTEIFVLRRLCAVSPRFPPFAACRCCCLYLLPQLLPWRAWPIRLCSMTRVFSRTTSLAISRYFHLILPLESSTFPFELMFYPESLSARCKRSLSTCQATSSLVWWPTFISRIRTAHRATLTTALRRLR